MQSLRKILVCALVLGSVCAGAAASLRGAAEPAAGAMTAKPALTVTTATPIEATLPLELAAHGDVFAWQEASVGAEANGLRLIEVRANVGDVVRRGQTLAVFASQVVHADLQHARATLAEARAAAIDAAANAVRARALAESGALSEQQVSQLVTAEQTALARVAASEAAVELHEVRLAQTRVLAPDDGVISGRNATVGAVVPAGQELFRLIRQGRLEWRAALTASELSRLRVGERAALVDPAGRAVEGVVRMLAPTVDASSRMGLVYVDLPRDSAFKAGMFAKGAFKLGASTALTAPQESVVVRDGFNYVFVLQPDGRVEQRKVTVGRRDAGRVELLDIEPDTLLVARGAGFLADGDIVHTASRQLANSDAPAAEPSRAEPRSALNM